MIAEKLATSLLKAEHLVIDIPGRTGIRPLDWTVHQGECWGILGPNGAGKTTLLLTLAGLKSPRSGQVLLDSKPLKNYSARDAAQVLGVLFQQQQDEFPAKALETALMGRHPHLQLWQNESPTDIELARHALSRMGLTELEDRNIQTLSGGERQRLGLATLLTQDPRLLLLDEPTNHLDLHHQMSVLELIRNEVKQDKCALLALHDLNLAARFCSHILLLYPDGQACWGEKSQMLVRPALEKLYQQPLTTTEVEGQTLFFPRSSIG